MKITNVTTAVVQANFDYTFVRIDSDEGVSGIGEAFMAPGLSATIRDLGAVIVGCDPRRPRPATARLMTAVSASGGASGAGMAYNAISGIEAALWDLAGRLSGVRVAELLGGAFRDAIPVYADLHAGTELASLDRVMRYRTPFWASGSGNTEPGAFFWEAPEVAAASAEAMIARARAAIAAGFTRLKFDLDVFDAGREPTDRTVSRRSLIDLGERVMSLRAAVGDDIELAFDCHWRFDVPTALAVAEAIEPAHPMWFEDPVPPDPLALATVSRECGLPVATGENTFLVDGFQRLVDHASCHILQPDVQKLGGIAEAVKVAELAGRSFRPIAPHCIASPVGFHAAAHVMAVAPAILCLEFHGIDVPFWSDLVVANAPIIADGEVRLADSPGLGAELDIDVVRRFAAPDEPVFDERPVR